MKIYLAGNSQYVSIWEWLSAKHQKALLSYHYVAIENSIFWTKTIKKMITTNKKVDLFLDSGAYSAWSQGKEIDIHEYIKFVKENKHLLGVYANLDIIGNPEATWKNQQIMEKAGLEPLPCFHYGDDEKYLKLMLEKYQYIALGGMVPISTDALIQWLDYLFSKFLTDEKGMPIVKIHGFGLTALRLMLRYPWFSVDSSSWIVTGRMGSIFIPKYRAGDWIYDENSWKIAVSNRSPSNKEAGKHITTLRPEEKRIFTHYITDKGYVLGKSDFKNVTQDYTLQPNEKWREKKPTDPKAKREVEIILEPGISNKYQLRDEMNIIYFLDLEKSIPEWPWSFKKKEVVNGFFK